MTELINTIPSFLFIIQNEFTNKQGESDEISNSNRKTIQA